MNIRIQIIPGPTFLIWYPIKNSVLVNQVMSKTGPISGTDGACTLLTNVKSGLNKDTVPSVLPTANCFPFADHVTALQVEHKVKNEGKKQFI